MKKIYSLLLIAIVLIGMMMLTACPWDKPEHVHSFKDEVIKPTCSEQGYTIHTCEECGYVREDTFVPVNPKAHNFIEVETVEPTCTEDGYVRYVCEHDESHEEFKTLKSGHVLGDYVVIIAPTCLSYGKERAFCENCMHYEDRDILPAHNYDVVLDVIEPTCTSEGYTVKQCSACGDTINANYVGKSAHFWTEWITETEGDCMTPGTKKRICVVCNVEEMGNFGYGHQYESEVVEPTCTESGYTVHTCKVCGDVTTDAYTPARHTWGEWEVTISPSCQAPGIERHVCSGCGKAEEQLVPSQHVYDNVTVVEPTTTESGYTIYACDCGDYYIDNYVPALGSDLKLETRTYWDYVSGTYVTEYIVVSLGEGKEIKDVVIDSEINGISVTTIAYMAFYGCDTLEKVYLSNSITRFDVAAFWYCTSLTEFHFDGTVEEWNAIDKGANWDRGLNDYTVYCTDGEIKG